MLPNVTQRPQVEVGRLANAVDMFIEGQSVINSHSQTPDASRKLDADALKVECAVCLTNLPLVVARWCR